MLSDRVRHEQLGADTISVDVSSALPFEREMNTVAASVHRPLGRPRAILVCWPGGSYDRRYWQFAAEPGYDFAAHMTAAGFVVINADPLGVGASSRPADVDAVTLEVMAAAIAEFTRQIRAEFGGGDGDGDGQVPVVGVGHSLGGGLTVIAQALHGCFDRIVSLGYTHGAKDAVVVEVDGDADERAAAVERARAFFADWDAGYAVAPREPNHPWLYAPGCPAALIAADDTTVTAWPRQAYVDALLTGFTARFAAAVECPVLLGFGDRDIPERPHDDACFYTGTSDLTIVVLPDAAHCHNFASTRTTLWDRIGAWAHAPAISRG